MATYDNEFFANLFGEARSVRRAVRSALRNSIGPRERFLLRELDYYTVLANTDISVDDENTMGMLVQDVYDDLDASVHGEQLQALLRAYDNLRCISSRVALEKMVVDQPDLAQAVDDLQREIAAATTLVAEWAAQESHLPHRRKI